MIELSYRKKKNLEHKRQRRRFSVRPTSCTLWATTYYKAQILVQDHCKQPLCGSHNLYSYKFGCLKGILTWALACKLRITWYVHNTCPSYAKHDLSYLEGNIIFKYNVCYNYWSNQIDYLPLPLIRKKMKSPYHVVHSFKNAAWKRDWFWNDVHNFKTKLHHRETLHLTFLNKTGAPQS